MILKKVELQLRQFGVFTHDLQEQVCLSTNDVAETDTTQSMLNALQEGRDRLKHVCSKKSMYRKYKFP